MSQIKPDENMAQQLMEILLADNKDIIWDNDDSDIIKLVCGIEEPKIKEENGKNSFMEIG